MKTYGSKTKNRTAFDEHGGSTKGVLKIRKTSHSRTVARMKLKRDLRDED